jgi:flagellar hook-length control protein FliK
MLRLIALAQGENVASWGFEGESDLEECFTDIRLGEFAIDYAKSLRNQCRKDSDDYEYWTAVLAELDWQQSRRTREGKSIACCMVGKYPARIPDLSDWKREVADIDSVNPEEEEQPAAKKEAAIFASEGVSAQSEQPTTVLKVSDSLGEPLKTIWLFTKERADWLTVRDVQRKDFAILKGKGSEQIHQYLGLLADSGYGEIDEEGKSHSSVRFKAH